jgi:hypothetical protein
MFGIFYHSLGCYAPNNSPAARLLLGNDGVIGPAARKKHPSCDFFCPDPACLYAFKFEGV